jgi:signal transduction histidine kinase
MAIGAVDVLLLDLVLPDIDGLHVLGELATRRDRTPVIMLSGHGQKELAVRALRAGAVDCIDKSNTQFLQVVDLVKRVHEQHSATAAAAKHPGSVGPFRVLLLESSVSHVSAITDFITRNTSQIRLEQISAPPLFERFLREDTSVHAVIVGPTPGTGHPLDVLRTLRSEKPNLPVVMLSVRDDGESAVAAFKLGAQDYILQKPDYLTELVFSLNNVLRRSDIEMQNARLTRELEALNRSLEAQVMARTAELQALSSRLLKIQEDERRAIARELHDQVGQMLTGLKFQLEAASTAGGSASQEKLVESIATVADIMQHVRQLTQLFRPRVLDDLGLQPALEWHAKQFERQVGIAIALDLTLPANRLPGELETVIFRVTQEALTNIARHAGCKTANVTVTHDQESLLLEITDRGRGFELAPVLARRDSLGLAGLRERVQLAGGKLEIVSRPGEGTRLHAEFPLPQATLRAAAPVGETSPA